MYNNTFLQKMYQQWQDGNDEYLRRWYDFVEMAARHNHTSVEVMLEELKKYKWFEWGEQ